MGENGAGKSTLIRILAGVVPADSGTIALDGQPVSITSARDAHRLGLRFLHQELNVLPRLSVAENLFLGRDYPTRLGGLIDWRALNERARAALAAFGIADVAPEAILGRLPVGDRLIVKIASTFVEDGTPPGRIFVMDEPTAALSHAEAERLFQIIGELKRRGCGIIYVSHRIEEVLRIADRITVLRDGVSEPPIARAEATRDALIERMTGRASLGAAPAARAALRKGVALSVQRLEAKGLEAISFEVREGEILGLAGLADAGGDRLLRALMTGARRGALSIGGRPVRLGGAAEGWRRGLAYVPRERRAEGLLLSKGVAENIALPHLGRLSRLGCLLNRPAERALAAALGRRVRLRATGPAPAGLTPQRRQPAKGDVRPRGRERPKGPPARRADAGRRRRGEIRHPCAPARDRRGRRGDSRLVLGPRGTAGALRPHRHPRRRPPGGNRPDRRAHPGAPARALLWRAAGMRLAPTAFVRRHGTLIGVAIVVLYFWLHLPTTFLTGRNLLNISQQMSMLAVVASGMTIVMAMGDFDLSVGSMASLAGIVAALVFLAGGSTALAVGVALSAGLAGGLINGFLVSYVGILPFIATLGAMTVLSGFAFWLSGGKTLFGSAIPQTFADFARGGLTLSPDLTLPNLTLVALLAVGSVFIFLEQTVVGRRLYAIGDNAEAARLAGVPVRPLRLVAFGLTGFGAAIAGLMYASRVASANPTQGAGLMLDSIAAVFLGQTMTEEGEPRVLATLAGVLILGLLGNGLTQMNVDSYVRDMLTGGILIAAVAASSFGRRGGG